MDALDIDRLRDWTGRTEEAHDVLDARLAGRFAATLDLDGPIRDGDVAPLLIHWCLAPPIVKTAEAGPDGHPARGGFLPPVPLPRRMWAGGALRFHDPLRIGDNVERRSTIADVALKDGRSGRLCFVTVNHAYTTPRGLALEERQDLVYREAARPETQASPARSEPKAAPARAEAGASSAPADAELSRRIEASPLLLFRYSALTFNGHRIHYDRDWCRHEEGYPDLVVHGPLQATLLAMAAAELLGCPMRTLSFRGVSPVFAGPVGIAARRSGDGIEAVTTAPLGTVAMRATAT